MTTPPCDATPPTANTRARAAPHSAADAVVRQATAEDAPALSVLGQATFLETFSTDIPGANLIDHCRREHAEAYYAAALARPATCAWIAELAATGAPVAYAMVCPPDIPEADPQPDDLELKRIYTLWRFLGIGVGATLMARARAYARAAGARRLLLGVYGGNDRAVAFYRRQGFEIIGARRFRVGDQWYDDAVMAAAL